MTDYAKIGAEALEEVKKLLASDEGWTEFGDGIMQRKVEGNSMMMYKGQKTVDGAPRDFWKNNSQVDVKLMKKESGTVDYDMHVIDDKLAINYSVSDMPWPVWKRDCVYLEFNTEEDGVLYQVWRSVEHEKFPPKPKKYVRATVKIACLRYEPKDGDLDNAKQTVISRVVHIDPEGSLPAMVVNRQAKSQVTGTIDACVKRTTGKK